MTIIGGLIKQGTKIGYTLSSLKNKRHESKSYFVLPAANQSKTLRELLNHSKNTDFGKRYRFEALSKSTDFISEFQKEVPLYNYEKFKTHWLDEVFLGKPNVIYPGKIQHFALTSGTSSGSSKKVPVTQEMIKQFQRTAVQQIIGLHELQLPAKFYNTSLLSIGGSTALTKQAQYFEGDLSGILQKYRSKVFQPFHKPSPNIAAISSWDDKLQAIVEKAPQWDIGVIAGVPSWVTMVIERILHHYKVKSIHEIWPNLEIYLHGGIFIDNYKERIMQHCDRPLHFINTYLTSEGYFGYQKFPVEKGMRLLTNHGVFYEFIPAKYVNQINNGDLENIPALSVREIQPNTSYALVVTTCSGIWRYIMGDLIQFSDVDKLIFNIEGRINHNLNLAGEHLSMENMTTAIRRVSEKMQTNVEEFCAVGSKQLNRHYWYVGSQKRIDEALFAVYLDEELQLLNDDYKTMRAYLIKQPRVKSLPLEKFYAFMALKGKLGGQNKFPRVLNQAQRKEWETFLSYSD